MRFSKWHALGNSYLVAERADAGEMTPDRVRRLCDVDLGIGADGVVEVESVEDARAQVVIWNPDGSTAEMSGNGTRIAARWLADRLARTDVVVAVGPRDVAARMLDGGEIETDVGPVEVRAPETIDVHGNVVELTPVSVGNPHAVVRCEEPARDVLLRLGPLIENHARFPERTNVQLAHARERPRGAGPRVGARGGGDRRLRLVRRSRRGRRCCRRLVQEPRHRATCPAATSLVRIDGCNATLVGPAAEICRGETNL